MKKNRNRKDKSSHADHQMCWQSKNCSSISNIWHFNSTYCKCTLCNMDHFLIINDPILLHYCTYRWHTANVALTQHQPKESSGWLKVNHNSNRAVLHITKPVWLFEWNSWANKLNIWVNIPTAERTFEEFDDGVRGKRLGERKLKKRKERRRIQILNLD